MVWTLSARRSRQYGGSSTCVVRQERQRARLGRSRRRPPPGSRIARSRA
nr:hypothetical protein [Streptomyces sp. WM6378]